MNVVGKVGSLISQGVYSVATPFHPFGGAVDIIVVKQEDGTYRSTPWYVRFGKFQGVLKGAEKVVSITVNGVEANFHMYLDNSGQAYFMREVSGGDNSDSNHQVSDELNSLESSISGNFDSNAESQSDPCDGKKEDVIENSDHPYRFQDEQASPESSTGSSSFSNYHYGSLDEVEDMVKESDDSNSEMVLISVDGHVLTVPISLSEENMGNVQLDIPQFHLGPGEGSRGDFGPTTDVWGTSFFSGLDASTDKHSDMAYNTEAFANGNVDIHFENTDENLRKTDVLPSCLDLTSQARNIEPQDMGTLSTDFDPNEAHSIEVSSTSFGEITIDSKSDIQYGTSEPLECSDSVDQVLKDEDLFRQFDPQASCLSLSGRLDGELTEIATAKSSLSIENMPQEGTDTSSLPSLTSSREQVHGALASSAVEDELPPNLYVSSERNILGLGFQISLCGNLLHSGMGYSSADEAFGAHRISEEQFKASGPSIIKNDNLIVKYDHKYFTWDNAAHIVLGKAVFGSSFSINSKDYIPVDQEEAVKLKEEASEVLPSASRRWRLWPIPFRRAKSLQHSNSNSSDELFVDSESGLQSPTAEKTISYSTSRSPRKQFLRSNSPTNEQIASLNLKEGQNLITFSFSTRVLGRQQVDAHIYLWKWNARIVISDVDGTITKSDVLGQFMPLVGKDWTQSGVARLFSAIRENGYQLLFLSARAIVQAYLTRSFLLNLKQDGKALPSGPVVISPDGLFPSLYREVVRRAPHEFKIACLEDIRALFPSDYNPFYAGFGNRDTDELSYRKIGIPKGKIFIINPKGEVAINHCVDVKSYTSLHTLVHDMFPPTPSVEQEDFNSWNYWKMPLPSIEV